MNIKYGMILAAGLGKRMQPLTLKTPKPLLEINNYTLLERAINLLISHGVQEISINVHYLSDQIKSFINRKKKDCFNLKILVSKINKDKFELLEGLNLAEYFITSVAEKILSDNEEIEVKKAMGKKCERCWKILDKKCSRKSCPIE